MRPRQPQGISFSSGPPSTCTVWRKKGNEARALGDLEKAGIDERSKDLIGTTFRENVTAAVRKILRKVNAICCREVSLRLSALSRIMKKNFSKHSSLWVGLVVLSLAVIGGCGGAAESAPKTPASDAQSSGTEDQSNASSEQTPEAVVSQFLDGVRRGGAAAEVGKLMTQKAQEQYAAVGLVMQPIGAPDAQFQITRSIPWGENGALVNSLWTESTPEGEKITYQVGWALRRESAGWRVSGLILDEQPEARVFNFESREDVLAIKQMQDASEPPAADSAPRQADNSDFSMPPLN